MEQVPNDSGEPKITRRRGPTPPAALFVEPAIPTQDAGDGDTASADAPPTDDTSRPSGRTPAKRPAPPPSPIQPEKAAPPQVKRSPTARAKPIPARFESAAPPVTEPETPKLANPRTRPTAEPLPIEMPTFSATEPPHTTKRLPAGAAATPDPIKATPEPPRVAPAQPTRRAPRKPTAATAGKATPPIEAAKRLVTPDTPEESPGTPEQSSAETAALVSPSVKRAKKAAAKKAVAEDLGTKPSPEQPELSKIPEEPTEVIELPALRTPEVTGADLWAAVKAEPRRAPAALALAVVAVYQADARGQADWLAARYPDVAPERLAGIARHNAVRRARIAAAASVPFAGVAGAPVLAWAHARLVLEVAAIFGRDPGEPERASEMLELLGVYRDGERAAAAVASVPDELREVPALPMRAQPIGRRVARHVAGKLWPGAGLLSDALTAFSSTDDLATRVIRFYRTSKAG